MSHSENHRTLRAPLAPSKLAPLLEPVQAFLAAKSAGGIVLMAAAVAALIWANSPWGDSYTHFWHTKVAVGFGGRAFAMSLEHWVNDGLMAVFFLLVGLEIKRELLVGELASPRRAALPIAAAVGGMVVPALVYAALNAGWFGGAGGAGAGGAGVGGDGRAAGWGIPMATDIAFAVGVLALVGRAVPTSVKVFLLAIAIVDDLGAVLVIALFYTGKLNLLALGIAGIFLALLIALAVLRVHSPLPYMMLGVGLWAATLASGLHATIAGVLLAFTIPAMRRIEEGPYLVYAREMLDCFEREMTVEPGRITEDQSHALKALEEASQAVQTPLARVEHALLTPVNFLIVPLFALANAGVDLRGGAGAALGSTVTWGVLLGLLIGKPVGVMLASWGALKMGLGTLPTGATWRQLAGVAVLCGIGFTMSLFVANLAFPGHPEHLAAAKVGILAASLAAGVAGAAMLATRGGRAGE